MKVQTYTQASTGQTAITVTLDPLAMMMSRMEIDLYTRIVENIAIEYVRLNYQEIAKQLDPQAIATLSISAGAAKINETLNKKMPDKVREIVKEKPVVYQRGLFGGLTRL